MGVEKVGDATERCDLGVGPETAVFGADSAVGDDGGGFDYCEGGAAVGKGGEVDKVEVS